MLRAHRERPRGRAAEKRDERAAFHSISSSARPDSGSGTVMPSVLAVLRLMYSSSRRLVSGSARTAECSARRTGPGRGRRARSSPLTFRRFGHTINTDEVFGTHREFAPWRHDGKRIAGRQRDDLIAPAGEKDIA